MNHSGGHHTVPHMRLSLTAVFLAAIGGGSAALAQGPLQAELRLLSHNVWGKTEAYCDQRMKGFGRIVADASPAYDIVGVTEYYDHLFACSSAHLHDAIRCSARYLNADNERLFYPRESGAPDGGQGIFTLGSICEFYVHRWIYQDTLEPRQGVILARIQIPNSTVTVDTYVVHIHSEDADGCDRCCRKGQLSELRDFIALHSARSGNPVVVMGDFNIAGPPTCCGPTGYEYIVTLLKNPLDLWLNAHPCGQANCGDGTIGCDEVQDIPCDRHECDGAPNRELHRCVANPEVCGAVFCTDIEPVPDCPPDAQYWGGWAGYTWDGCLNEYVGGQERIDYIFIVSDPALSSSAFTLAPLESKITDFMAIIDPPLECVPCIYPDCGLSCPVTDHPPRVGHVSDHLGVEATLQIIGRNAVWVDNLASGVENGSSCDPFNTVSEGVAAISAGDRVLLRSGSYHANITITRALTLQAIGGTVTIGD